MKGSFSERSLWYIECYHKEGGSTLQDSFQSVLFPGNKFFLHLFTRIVCGFRQASCKSTDILGVKGDQSAFLARFQCSATVPWLLSYCRFATWKKELYSNRTSYVGLKKHPRRKGSLLLPFSFPSPLLPFLVPTNFPGALVQESLLPVKNTLCFKLSQTIPSLIYVNPRTHHDVSKLLGSRRRPN